MTNIDTICNDIEKVLREKLTEYEFTLIMVQFTVLLKEAFDDGFEKGKDHDQRWISLLGVANRIQLNDKYISAIND